MAQVDLKPDYTEVTQYLVPDGWTVQSEQQDGRFTWLAESEKGSSTAPGVFVLALPDNLNASANFVIQLLKQETPSLELLDRKDLSADETHFLFTASEKDAPSNIVAMFLRDRNQKLIFIAAYGANVFDYKRLGNESLFYKMLKRPNPFAEADNYTNNKETGIQASLSNPQDLSLQQQVLANEGPITPSQLRGEWLQAFSMATSESYVNQFDGRIQYGEKGYGHLLKFNADGTYQLTYSYNNLFQNCRNEVEMVEKGTYHLKDNTLTLKNARYSGSFNVCGQLNRELNTKGKERSYQLGLNASGDILVIRGSALEYSISTEVDANGLSYIQEGFKKL